MTYYWNKEYFEGLKEIGEAYISRPNYELFGEYCLKKEQGYKKLANKSAANFVDFIQEMPPISQKEVVIHLCQLSHDNPRVHSLINHPIAKLIQTVLKYWSTETPDSIEVFRWYARYCFDETGDYTRKIINRALEIDPNDQLVLFQSINKSLYYVEYIVHHLNDNVILGALEEAHEQLAIIKEQIPRIVDQKEKNKFQSQYDYYSTLFRLWEEYQSSPQETLFIDWAFAKENFEW